jgi:hypothetical protein
MNVIQPVAAITGGLQDDLADVLGCMTGVTIETLMSSGQRILRLGAVIEAPSSPTVRVVTESAIRSQAALVKLILVATGASRPRILEQGRVMTFLAGDGGVQPDERKSCKIVIERHCLAPCGVSMALIAAISELAAVGIILLVTGDATRAQLVAKEIAGMAIVAFDLDVAPSQRKPRPAMIELNSGPFVLTVAVFAFRAVATEVNVLDAVTRDAG